QVIEDALHRRFDPEFINRIDRVLTFARIGTDQLEQLLRIELDKLSQRLGRLGRLLAVEDSARAWLCRDHDIRFGARALARCVRTELEPAIAGHLLANPETRHLICTYERGSLRVRGAGA